MVTNRDLLVRVLRHPTFLAGELDTAFLDRHPEVFAPLLSSVDAVRVSCLAAALAGAAARRASAQVLGAVPSGWRNVPSNSQTTVYDGPAGPVEVGYRLDRTGELANWWVRAVDPDELDLAGLGQAPVTDDHPPAAVVSATGDRVVLDVNGIRLSFHVRRVGEISYVDSPEGSVALHELPRFPLPTPELAEGSLVAPLPGAVGRVLVDRRSAGPRRRAADDAGGDEAGTPRTRPVRRRGHVAAGRHGVAGGHRHGAGGAVAGIGWEITPHGLRPHH